VYEKAGSKGASWRTVGGGDDSANRNIYALPKLAKRKHGACTLTQLYKHFESTTDFHRQRGSSPPIHRSGTLETMD